MSVSLPPGPRAPRPLQTYWWGNDPVGLFDRCAQRYGTPFTLRLSLVGATVCVADPDDVRTLFRGDPAVFHAGEAYEVLGPVAGPTSLLLLDEEEHLRMRRLLLPPLHGEALRRWRPLIEEITERTVAGWPEGEPVRLRDSMEAITLEVIMRIVFGIRDPRRAELLGRLLPGMFDVGRVLGSAFVVPALRRDLGPLSPWGRFVRRRAQIDSLLYEEIRRRRADLARGDIASAGRDDVLSLLLAAHDEQGRAMSDRELRDALVTMLLAGQETTATALAWVFERLLRNPLVLARLRAELARGDGAYLDAVIRETLRIRPVVAQVGRKLTRDAEIGGWTVPAGRMLMASISRLHRSPELYPKPDAFRPERFLDGDPGGYEWIPFGGGVRRCIGAGLALLEMRAVITTVLGNVELAPADEADEQVVVRGITLAPSRGGRVIAERRAA